MPKTCPQCKYYSPNNEETECPQCRAALKFTLLGSPNEAPAPIQHITPVEREPSVPRTAPGWSFDLDWAELIRRIQANRMLFVYIILPLIVLVLFMVGGVSGGDKFQQIQLGMTWEEVDEILDPRTGRPRLSAFTGDENGNGTLTINRQMVLVFQNGRLVEKTRLNDKNEVVPP